MDVWSQLYSLSQSSPNVVFDGETFHSNLFNTDYDLLSSASTSDDFVF